ncbi:MAG: hypothetical protein ACTSYI_15640 [Promethearchaeota archaeon]
MKKFALREINPHKNLPEEVQKEWKNALSTQYKGKVPKLFQCESLFAGSDPDYIILIEYPLRSLKNRGKYHGFFYNNQYPQVSELKELLISPDYGYLELLNTRLSQLMKKILMKFLFPSRYCLASFDPCKICYFQKQLNPNGTDFTYCNHTSSSDWCPFFRFDRRIIKRNVRFRNYTFKYYNWKHVIILGIYNFIFGMPNDDYSVDLCWNCRHHSLTKRFQPMCNVHLHNSGFRDCPEFKFAGIALYLRLKQRVQSHIRQIQLLFGTAPQYQILFAPEFSESLKDMIAEESYAQGIIPDEEELQIQADDLMTYLQSKSKPP